MEKEGEAAEPGKIKKETHAELNAWQREQHEAHLRALNALTHELKSGREAEEASDRGKSLREYLTIFLLLLTVVLTALTFVVFYEQLGEMRRATRGAHEDAAAAMAGARADSAAAVKQAQEANAAALGKAADANAIASDTAKRQLRAYVSAAPGTATGMEQEKVLLGGSL